MLDAANGMETAAQSNTANTAMDFAELDEMPKMPQTLADTGWRWEVKGSGKYKGQYYNWRWGSGKYRKYRNGGKLANARAALPQRTGKGNRKPRRIDTNVSANRAQFERVWAAP